MEGPPHYHDGSRTVCYCIYSGLPQYAPQPLARRYTTVGDPRDYAPPIRRVPRPKSNHRITKSRAMKFDESHEQWYFETKEAPGIKWLESAWHVPDLPQARDPDFIAMVNEYYLCGHVMDMPEQDRLPVMPGGMKRWPYHRSPPPERERPLPPIPPPETWAEPIHRHPSAPPYASGSAHPVSIAIPPGMPHLEAWHPRSTGSYVPQSVHATQPHYPSARAPPELTEYDSDGTESEYLDRAFIPPPSRSSRKMAEQLRAKGYRVQNPYENAASHSEPELPFIPPSSHYPPKPNHKIEIHRLLQTKSSFGISKIPDLVFDLRYDPKHAFDRTGASPILANIPAFQPGQDFVRFVIRHPFNGRGGDWIEDIDEAARMSAQDVIGVISEMVHRHIDQTLDWEPLSETDRSFVYEAYANRPCPDEDAAGKRIHMFCDKYMFGGIEQLAPKAKGASAERPSFLVKLMRNSKHKTYERLAGFSVPRMATQNQPGRKSRTTYPTLTESVSGSEI